MIDKKFIITTAVVLGIITTNSVNADSANNLLKMDVKRASSTDSVDVTFYTTEGSYNSVVTRKSDNRYVVLLPNTASTSSIVPSLGGVKDLISDVNVKNVDDGIGGYTKVTFTTTKPVKIQTYTKKTAPLTKAQEEYKNLIAKHESSPAAQNVKPVSNTTTTNATNNNKQSASTAKPTTSAQSSVKPVTNTQKTQTSSVNTNKNTTNSIKTVAPAASNSVKPAASNNSTPQAKAKVNVPAESTNITTNTAKPTESATLSENNVTPQETTQNNISEVEKTATTKPTVTSDKKDVSNSKSKLGKMPLYGALAVVGLFLLGGLFNLIAGLAVRGSRKLSEFKQNYELENVDSSKSEYERIMNDTNLNWQEKYKQYTQADKKLNSQIDEGLTFVTDSNAKKRAIVDTVAQAEEISQKSELQEKKSNISIPSLGKKRFSFKARVSQMEHALQNTPNLYPADINNSKGVQSEEEQISKRMSDVKLKSFAKTEKLGISSRSALSNFRKNLQNQENKEGNFVKLKNSPLSATKRISPSSISGVTNVIKYENNLNNKAVDMVSKKMNYTSTSLGEYLSRLDENDNLVNMQSLGSEVVGNKVTNPIQKTVSNLTSEESNISDMKVISSYELDSDKGFYLVDEGNTTALVSKNKGNTSVLKRFNSKIKKSLQVRLDYDSVYIVRVGDYKCLVDIESDKTLLEI